MTGSKLCPVCGVNMAVLIQELGYTRHPNCNQWTRKERAERDQNPVLPERPYVQEGAPSAGYSGTDTSREGEPLRAGSQRAVLAFVSDAGYLGATVKEAREALGMHHGITSGALSVLHKGGWLARLTVKRDRCRVYVRSDVVAGREHD